MRGMRGPHAAKADTAVHAGHICALRGEQDRAHPVCPCVPGQQSGDRPAQAPAAHLRQRGNCNDFGDLTDGLVASDGENARLGLCDGVCGRAVLDGRSEPQFPGDLTPLVARSTT